MIYAILPQDHPAAVYIEIEHDGGTIAQKLCFKMGSAFFLSLMYDPAFTTHKEIKMHILNYFI